jgi:hypothetical protein
MLPTRTHDGSERFAGDDLGNGASGAMTASEPAIRLGLLVDSLEVPAWAHHALERAVTSGCARIELLIFNAARSSRRQASVRSLPAALPFAYRVLSALDAALFAREPDPFASKEIGPLCRGVPQISVEPKRGMNCLTLEAADVSRIREFNLDVLVQLGFAGLEAGSVCASRFGVWYHNHSDAGEFSDQLPGFWEVARNESTTGSSLHAAGGPLGRPAVLCRSSHFTYSLSPARNRSYYFWASAAFLPRQLELLRRLGGEAFLLEAEKNPEPVRSGRTRSIPSNLASALCFSRIFARSLGTLIRRVSFRDTWFLLYELNGTGDPDFRRFKALMPPRDRFWADPMIVRRDGQYYIFIEEFLYSTGKGHISVIEMDGDGRWKDPVPILRSPVHLSYPFVFSWEGRDYMIPESAEGRTIELYECESFPRVWRLKTCLMKDVTAVDTTLLRHDGKWWLFTAVSEHPGSHPQVELFLYYTDDLFSGRWVSHPMNPIVSDIRRARPAGRIFVEGERIFRPSQNCGSTYGYGFDINEVEILNETDYREKKVRSVRPDWDKRITGCHTFAKEGPLTVIDAFTRRWAYSVKASQKRQ